MPFFDSENGVSLFYDEVGEGRPVLFLHGWAMSGRVWHYQHELADRFRLIFLDFRGHGRSSAAGSYSLENYASDVVALVELLDLHDAVLVGWSMGAQVALQSCRELRSRLAGAVLVGGTPRFTTAADYEHGKPAVEVKGMGVRLRRDYQRTLGDFFKGMFAPGESEGAQYQRIVHEVVMGGHSPNADAVLGGLQILGSADLRPALPEIDLPVMLVHGDGDTIIPSSASRFMAEALPNATLHIVPGSGHAPFLTKPETVNPVLREFLERLEPR